MRRRSMITIITLILAIIGLVCALVYVKLQPIDTDKNEEIIQNDDSLNEENIDKNEDEKPTYISLDSDIVKDAYRLAKYSEMHYIRGNEITIDSFTNEQIQRIGYSFTKVKNYILKPDENDPIGVIQKIENSKLKKAIEEIFGEVKYNSTGITSSMYDTSIVGKYNEEKDMYYIYDHGGGPRRTAAYTAIYSAVEYSDRYEILEKMIYFVSSTNDEYPESYSLFSWCIPEQRYYLTKIDMDSVNVKALYAESYIEVHDADVVKKLISAYFDQATTYKHIFNKNEDGSYYWYKTVII